MAQQEDRKLLPSAAGLQGLGTGERQEAPALTFHQVQKSDGRCWSLLYVVAVPCPRVPRELRCVCCALSPSRGSLGLAHLPTHHPHTFSLQRATCAF